MKLRNLFLLAVLPFLAGQISAQTANYVAAARIVTDGTSDPFGLLESEDEVPRKRIVGSPAPAAAAMASAERSAFLMINHERASRGFGSLRWSDELAAVARLHSQNMAEFSFFSHKGLDSGMVSDRADRLNIGKWKSIGENIAFNRGFGDPVAKTVELWLDSPSHLRNMMDPQWSESGIGAAKAADGSVYFTQVFLVRR